MAPKATQESTFSPLRQKLYAVLWVAMVIGNIGSFVRDLASAWLMTELSPSPVAVALIQAAATFPVMLLAVPAGVLADIFDRRRLLIGIQLLLAVVSSGLMLLAVAGMHSVTSLLLLTLLGGIGAALMAPAWQAVVPELVGCADLRNAVTLNSLGLNIARAIGPALGGVTLAMLGAAFSYGVDVISYLVVIAALIWWRPRPKADDRLAEQFSGAFRAGLRFVRASRELHVVLLRAFLFFAMASALWALLPLVARQLLDGGAGFYGLLLSAVGFGAIAGAVSMPSLRQRFDADALILLASLLTALVMVFVSCAPPQWAALLALYVLGAAWISALTTLNGVAQSILPNWVRGRALAVYLTAFNAAMTFGSLAWGLLAKQAGLPATLLLGAASLLLVTILTQRFKLPCGEADLEASNHWPEPLTAAPIENDRGPVMIMIEYRVKAPERGPFLKLLETLADERRRDGAYRWWLSEDSADPEYLLECFLVESWGEHLRQHRRGSQNLVAVQQAVRHYLIEPPRVRHLLAIHSAT